MPRQPFPDSNLVERSAPASPIPEALSINVLGALVALGGGAMVLGRVLGGASATRSPGLFAVAANISLNMLLTVILSLSLLNLFRRNRAAFSRRQVEENLQNENRKAISELLESVSDGFVTFDRDWRYVQVNPAAARLSRKTPEELLGKTLWEVFPAAQGLTFGLEFRRAMEQRVPVTVEDFYPEPLNAWFEVRCHPTALGLNLFFTDITERKSNGQRLRQLSRAVEQSPSSVMITDTKGILEYVNPKFTEVTGYSFDEAVGKNPRILKSGEYPRESYKELWKTIKAGREWRGEFHNRKRNGELYWESASISAITDETGAITHFLAVKEDITERKKFQTALLEAKETAEEANRSKDAFLANLSHELRTPLTPVLLTASSLEHDTALNVDLRAHFTLIRSNIELEARLIDDLLDLTRIAHGKFSIRRQSLDAGEVLSATLEILRSDYLGKHIAIQTDAAASGRSVHGDPVRLQQLFWNLLRNAIKFTPPGGAIYVRTFNSQPRSFSIEIRDTGIGIDPEFLREIFDPFQQGAVAGQPQYGGLGLGLAISKTITEVHGGTITAASAGRGLGATFTVELPLSGETSDPEENTETFLVKPSAPRRILLVEDNEPTREVLARLLRKDGHQVEAVGSCAEALKAARCQPTSEPFQALVCDLGLPDGSGLDIVRELKATMPDLTGVALSGYGTDDDILRSRQAGFTEHLVKPASIQDLRRVLAA